jgi:5-formyltetrahydrofolate cyclo-ligase
MVKSPRSRHPQSERKARLRELILTRRSDLSETERQAHDQARTERLLAALDRLSPGTVALYWAVPPEPDCRALIDALTRRNITVLLPILSSWPTTQVPHWGRFTTVENTRPVWRGIREPIATCEPAFPADVVVMPGLAGTAVGFRLGVGGGWYDRVLADCPTIPRWLVLNDNEIVDDLPVEPWDQLVDAIFTERQRVTCSGRANILKTTYENNLNCFS